jgi:hypothetical protein
LHYFAAKYYDERGQLFNASREYRQMRKKNKESRLEAEASQEAAGITEPLPPPRRGGWIKGKGKTEYPKDMYQVMDGSAMLAIGLRQLPSSHCSELTNIPTGMFLEEWVAKMLQLRKPDGWEGLIKDSLDGEMKNAEADRNVGEESEDEWLDDNDEDDDEKSPSTTLADPSSQIKKDKSIADRSSDGGP